MAQHGKKYRAALEKIEEGRKYSLDEGLAKVREISEVTARKFDETVELTMWLGVDPRKADQLVRGTVVLPHGVGKTVRVLVIAQGEKVKEAEDAGADMTGGEDVVNRIKGGWLDFDAVIATPDMMRLVGQLGKVLGPRGLMPNPKTGTVTFDVANAVRETKAGKVEYRVDKTGVIHVGIGKVSFEPDRLRENAQVLLDAVVKATLARKAAAGTAFEGAAEHFKGVTALALAGGDPVQLSKAISKFVRENPEVFTFKAGVVEGRVVALKDVEAIASLPPKEELISKIMFLINCQAQRLVTVLSAVPRNLAIVVKQIGEQKGGEAAS